jgi:hypothetical protein
MELNPSREAASYAATQALSCALRNPKINWRIHVLIYINPIHIQPHPIFANEGMYPKIMLNRKP